jgi:Carboxypeptidase Taq (M32) metallopeptidase
LTEDLLILSEPHNTHLLWWTMSADKLDEALRLLKDRLATIGDVNAARKLLTWDRQTYMPEGGISARAEQAATLSRLVHEMLVSEETAKLLDSVDEPEPGSDDFALLRLARREHERAVKLPTRLGTSAGKVGVDLFCAPSREDSTASAGECRVFGLRRSSLRRLARPL